GALDSGAIGPADADGGAEAAETGAGPPVLLIPGAKLVVKGVTADDYVVYFDVNAQSYYAAPFGGGTATLLYELQTASGHFVTILGKLVFLQTWGPTANYRSQLTLWSSAVHFPIPVSNTALLQYTTTIWASDDGKAFIYPRAHDDPTTGDIYGVDGDGENPTL